MFHIPFQIKRSDMHQVEYWVGKRLAYFEQTQNEEQKVIQKQRVLRQFEKYLQSKELCKVVPEDVVRFLIFKEMEGKGRTIVHKQMCKNLGSLCLTGCEKEKCGLRHAYDSLRSGYLEKLKSIFEEAGFSGKWNPQRSEGNPTKLKSATVYGVCQERTRISRSHS